MRLVYEKLVGDYLDSLHQKLRNFTVEPEFLTMWVHDENDGESLLGIFLAAQGGGCPKLTVSVSAKVWRGINEAWLRRELGRLGEVDFDKSLGASELTVNFEGKAVEPKLAPAAGLSLNSKPGRAKTTRAPRGRKKPAVAGVRPAGEIHLSYRQAIEKAGQDIRLETPLPAPADGQQVLEVNEGEAKLSALVDLGGVVVAARHSGAQGPLRALLDQLCRLMPGRPLQEAHDHAIIRLENQLRDQSLPPSVEGLLTSRNADPVFVRPEDMIRRLFDAYLEKTGKLSKQNFWDDSALPHWLTLDQAARRALGAAAVLEGCRELGLPQSGVEILEILGDVRIVLAHTPNTSQREFALGMIKLERSIKRRLDPRIELQLESLEDRNKRAQRTHREGKPL